MVNYKKSFIVCITLVTYSLLGPLSSDAEQQYVIDTLFVSLREGPGSSNKAVSTVQSGQPLEVIGSQDGYFQVRTADGIEGWLPKQYASVQPPSAVVIQELKAKNDELSAQNGELSAQLAEIAAKKEAGEEYVDPEKIKLEEQLKSLTDKYKQLENDSQDTVTIQNENSHLKGELTSIRRDVTRLQEENNSLGQRQKIYWFLAGALVFWIGWLTGKVSVRRPRHSLTL